MGKNLDRTKIKMKVYPDGEEVVRSEAKMVYMQDNDSCDEGSDGQFLEIEAQEAGGGYYLTFSTDRWALNLDELEEILDIFKDFKKRIK